MVVMELHECERSWKSFVFVGFVEFCIHASAITLSG